MSLCCFRRSSEMMVVVVVVVVVVVGSSEEGEGWYCARRWDGGGVTVSWEEGRKERWE